jgi:D-alanyl-D-alanine carboxypeptidase
MNEYDNDKKGHHQTSHDIIRTMEHAIHNTWVIYKQHKISHEYYQNNNTPWSKRKLITLKGRTKWV